MIGQENEEVNEKKKRMKFCSIFSFVPRQLEYTFMFIEGQLANNPSLGHEKKGSWIFWIAW